MIIEKQREEYLKDFSGDRQKEALIQALDIRKFEIELYWKRAGYFWTFIAVAFAWGSVLMIPVVLNNIPGIFIFDPGASLVSVTKSFAMKARLVFDSENEVTLHTANGLAKGILSTANSVQVGSVLSTSVPVVIMDDRQLRMDDDVVGLLGMSFLSRFEVKFTRDSVELRSR